MIVFCSGFSPDFGSVAPSHWENDQIFLGVRGTVDVDGTGECIFDPRIRALCGLRFPFTEVFFAIYLQKNVHFYTLF